MEKALLASDKKMNLDLLLYLSKFVLWYKHYMIMKKDVYADMDEQVKIELKKKYDNLSIFEKIVKS